MLFRTIISTLPNGERSVRGEDDLEHGQSLREVAGCHSQLMRREYVDSLLQLALQGRFDSQRPYPAGERLNGHAPQETRDIRVVHEHLLSVTRGGDQWDAAQAPDFLGKTNVHHGTFSVVARKRRQPEFRRTFPPQTVEGAQE